MGTGDPATYGHFGRSGSFLWLDPTAGVGCCGLSTEPFGTWSVPAWSALADAVRAEVGDAGRPPAGPE
jgi:CubicO group peptidase (beta-lactamase class C family)